MPVTISASDYLWLETLVYIVLLVCHRGMGDSPRISSACCLQGVLAELRALGIRRIDACGKSHRCGEVKGGGGAFLHNITWLAALCGHHEALERRCRQLMVDTTIMRVLHGEHPAEVVHNLVKIVGDAVR